MSSDHEDGERSRGGERGSASLVELLLKRTGKVAGDTLDLALDVASVAAMSGDSWLRNVVTSSASPERLEAMAEAGHFLRDARETAGLSIAELSERLDFKDPSVLADVERGEAILPLEIMLRAVSLLARHDPIPFLIKFLRSYNPQLEATLEQWGVMALPRNYERERRFLNLYRQHDFLRELSDDEHARFIDYMNASTQLVVDVMERERAAGEEKRKRRRGGAGVKSRSTGRRGTAPRSKTASAASSLAGAKSVTGTASRSARAGNGAAKSAAGSGAGVKTRPVVRKVKAKPRAAARAARRDDD